jgi:hypothetical protein
MGGGLPEPSMAGQPGETTPRSGIFGGGDRKKQPCAGRRHAVHLNQKEHPL